MDTLQERVIAWFEGQGDIPSAIEQALIAGMQDRAARLMESIAALFVTRTRRLRTFQRWIDQLDADTRARFPLLLTRLGPDYANFSLYEAAPARNTSEFSACSLGGAPGPSRVYLPVVRR